MLFNIKHKSDNRIKYIKLFLTLILLTLLVVDIILAIGKTNEKGLQYPTYSKLFYLNKDKMIWFIFMFGCLVSKIFYNRFTIKTSKEMNGIIILLFIALILFIIGRLGVFVAIPDIASLSFFILGIIAAYQLWPQYKK